MPEGLFRTFHRDHRPLSEHLMQTYGRPLFVRAAVLATEDPDADPDRVVAVLLAVGRVQPPVLGGMERAYVRDREGLPRPTAEAGTWSVTSRHYVAIEVADEAGLLEHWPDQADQGLAPIDSFDGDPYERAQPGAPYDFNAELTRYGFEVAQDRWTVGLRTDEGPVALYTFVDLADAEERAVAAGERDVAAEIVAMRAEIQPIVAAIGAQTRAFYDEALPPLLRGAVIGHQERARARRAVQESLSWPDDWKQPEPVLCPPVAEEGTAGAPPTAEDGLEPVDLHVVPAQVRLSGASYQDVIRTLRIWADAVERHPKAYTGLFEDRVSDLIVATLNAALPGAHREVYSRGGKSDLYIRADALAEGKGPAKVFIGECKWWTGPTVATAGLSQLFGYLDIKDLASVLILLVPLKDPAVARSAALDVLRARDGFVGADDELAEGWPQLRFEHEGRVVRVCLAFVDLPR